MSEPDWPHVQSIYTHGIATGDATFEEHAPTWDEWDSSHLKSCRLVARLDGDTVAWAALSPVSDRDCYRGVVEATVYVASGHRGTGVGRRLGRALIEASEAEGIWTIQAMVFPENDASLALLEQGGFREVGVRERIGQHNGRWRDVTLLERRSHIVGND